MPVYNAAPYVKQAVESILQQSFKDFELIIVNDGSTDGSAEILKAITDHRIVYVENVVNEGIISTRNKALQLARGKYIACMDADDVSLPERLQKQVDYLDLHPDVSFLATRLMLVDAQNQPTGVWPEDYYCVSTEIIKQTLPQINCVGQPTVMMRAQVAKSIGYNKKYKANEDWGMWLTALSEGYVIAKLPDVLLRYRQHTVNTTVVANKSGVARKIRRFKRLYLTEKITSFQFRSTDKLVLKSYLKDLFKAIISMLSPRLQVFLGRWKLVRKARLLKQFLKARTYFRTFSPDLIFVFPFFHTGGAERVHADILGAFGNTNRSVLTLVTSESDNRAFLDRFEDSSHVLEINELLKLGFTERWLIKHLLANCKKKPSSHFFGSNAKFLYELLPHLPSGIEAADLIHAFVHEYEDGPEKWSLPVVSRLTHRVVISHKTKNDLVHLYQKKDVPAEYASRIAIIPNSIENVDSQRGENDSAFKVAYVGRPGEEKRVDLIAEVARDLRRMEPNIEFHFVGNIEFAIPESLRADVQFHGEITDQAHLNKLYDEFHVLVIASTREGFPMVIMEAMMHAVVPVTTSVGGIPEHIQDGKNGILIPHTDTTAVKKDLMEKIKYLYLNKAEWQRMSNSARAYAVQHFGRETFNEAYRKLLLNSK